MGVSTSRKSRSSKKRSNRLNHPAAFDEDVANIGVHDQVDIALAIAFFRILESVEFFGQGPGGLAEQPDFGNQKRPFPGLGLKQAPCQAHKIADIQLLEKFIGLIPDAVLFDIGLKLSGSVPESNKRGFPKPVNGHHPAGGYKYGRFRRNGFRMTFDLKQNISNRMQYFEVIWEKLNMSGFQFSLFFSSLVDNIT